MPSPKKNVSMDQIANELAEYHRPSHHLSIQWTDEMDGALLKARDEFTPPVSYPALQKFFMKKWGCCSEQTLRRRYRELKEQGR